MSQNYQDFVMPAKVIKEDGDFITLEVGKHDAVSWKLKGGEEFLTVSFIKNAEGNLEMWKPWEHEAK